MRCQQNNNQSVYSRKEKEKYSKQTDYQESEQKGEEFKPQPQPFGPGHPNLQRQQKNQMKKFSLLTK